MYQLIPESLSRDIVTACGQVYEGAAAGHIIGGGFILLLRRHRLIAEFSGEALREPILMRGAVRSLDDELMEMVRRRRDSPTTS